MFTIPVTLYSSSASVTPLTATLTDTDENADNQPSYSVTMDIGANTSGSMIVFGCGSRANAARTVTGVTCDGVAMTLVGTGNDTSGGADIATMWRLPRSSIPDPTQTNADFVITFSDVMLRATFAAYQISGPVNMTPNYANNDNTQSAGVLSLNDVDCPANGTVIGLAWFAAASPTSVTWSGLSTEDFDINTETASNVFSGAHQNFTTTQTNITVSATDASGTTANGSMVIASWGP